jgi:ABC-type uncharacterized transport system fused permease/ATPase subunit
MSNIINLRDYKRSKQTQEDIDTDVKNRINKLRESINRLNSLMQDLNRSKESKENNNKGGSRDDSFD